MDWAQISLPGYLRRDILSPYVKNSTHIQYIDGKNVNIWNLRSHKKWGQDLGAKEMEEPTRLARHFGNTSSVLSVVP